MVYQRLFTPLNCTLIGDKGERSQSPIRQQTATQNFKFFCFNQQELQHMITWSNVNAC